MKFERIYHPDSNRILIALEMLLTKQPPNSSRVITKSIIPDKNDDLPPEGLRVNAK